MKNEEEEWEEVTNKREERNTRLTKYSRRQSNHPRKMLCKKVPNIDTGYPLHLACKAGMTPKAKKIILILIRSGADVNTADKRGQTPLMAACQERNIDAVQILLEHGANVNSRSPKGNTALHYLIKPSIYSYSCPQIKKIVLKICKVLFQHGMEQQPNNQGLTPIWSACMAEKESIVKYLLGNLTSVNESQKGRLLRAFSVLCSFEYYWMLSGEEAFNMFEDDMSPS